MEVSVYVSVNIDGQQSEFLMEATLEEKTAVITLTGSGVDPMGIIRAKDLLKLIIPLTGYDLHFINLTDGK